MMEAPLARQEIFYERPRKREAAPSGVLLALNISLALISGSACILSFFWLIAPELKILACVVFISLFVYAVYRLVSDSAIIRPRPVVKDVPVSKLCLLDEHGERLREWPLINRVSIIIGRDDTGHRDVDIDLAEVQYASLVAEQHAVLNYASGEWYIEDLHTENGVRIQKSADKTPYKLSKKTPCRLSVGDILHIAQTRLLVQ